MKKMQILNRIAVLTLTVFMIVACSCDEEVIENQGSQDKIMTLTTTLSYGKTTNTRSIMTDTGSGITAEWEVGDKILVMYYGYGFNQAQGEVIAVDPTTKAATIRATLINPQDGGDISFGYPYEILKKDQALFNVIQSGKLEDVSNRYASIIGWGTMNVSDNTVSLASAVEMEQNVCIWKLSFTDGTNDITNEITNLSINIKNYPSDEGFTYQINPSSQTVIYAALHAGSSWLWGSDVSVTFTATTLTSTYIKSKSNISLENGKSYNSTNLPLTLLRQGNTVFLPALSEYEVQDGETLTGIAGDNAHITVAPGATITLQDADITSIPNDYDHNWPGITCLGDATINLSGTNVVKGGQGSNPGIFIEKNCTLTIQGDGKLDAYCNSSGAGIGARGENLYTEYQECGNIIIKSGIINAVCSGDFGIGIGCSANAGSCGDIIIEGGEVSAIGYYTGIGCVEGSCGNIAIKDGVIAANCSGSFGIGIGCRGNSGSCGDIIIEGGEVIAMGETGIGCNYGSCGKIVIKDGNITTTAGVSAIGAGFGNCGEINIEGGYIDAYSSMGRAIGSGIVNDSSCDDIIISNGTVIAKGGIGAGSGTCGNITISGGDITATGYRAGIGGGDKGSCGDITITGGKISATGYYSGSGIGGGDKGSCGNITITGGEIEARSAAVGDYSYGAGIGGGDTDANCGNIYISGGTIEATGSVAGSGIGAGNTGSNCLNITIENTVTKVIAIKGQDSSTSIGKGESSTTCGTVTIGGVVYPDGITDSPYIYQP